MKEEIFTSEYKNIKAFNEEFSDMPDGVFFALAEERGIGLDEWIYFSEASKFDPDYKS